MTWYIRAVILIFVLVANINSPKADNPVKIRVGGSINSDAEAVNYALTYLGIDDTAKGKMQTDVNLCVLSDTSTELSRDYINGLHTWSVILNDYSVGIGGNGPYKKDTVFIKFRIEIVLDSLSGKPLYIRAINQNVEDYPKRGTINESPFYLGHIVDFHEFCSEAPNISFFDVLSKCQFYPSISREIVGFCGLIRYNMSDSVNRAWVVSMLGLPEMTTSSGSIYNNFRVIIDAEKGDSIIAFFSIGYPPVDKEGIGELGRPK